jgi:DNA-binding PadR family transcriptional regulator
MAKTVFGLGRPSARSPLKVGPVQVEILCIIRDHPDKAFGAGIAGHLRDHRGHDVSDAQTYIAIRRLDARGLIAERKAPARQSQPNTPSDSRRGRPHKLYSLTASGKRALEQSGTAANSKAGTDAQREGIFDAAYPEGPTPVVG